MQLSKAQPELSAYFDVPTDESSHRIVELVPDIWLKDASLDAPHGWRWRDVPRSSWGPGMYATLEGEGRPILFGRSVYASGYDKSLALMLACTVEATSPPTHIFFIDDAPNNAYGVHRDLPDRLRQWTALELASSANKEPASPPVVRALWWDLYEEEFETRTMAPTTSGPDFAYLRDAERSFVYGAALRHFGLSQAAIAERAKKYERVQTERDERRTAQAAVESLHTKAASPTTPQSSMQDRRNQLHGLLVATGRAPGT